MCVHTFWPVSTFHACTSPTCVAPGHSVVSGAITRIMVCGGAALTPGVPEFLNRRFGVPAEIANPLARVQYDPALFAGQDVHKVAPLLTVGIGLALRRTGDKS